MNRALYYTVAGIIFILFCFVYKYWSISIGVSRITDEEQSIISPSTGCFFENPKISQDDPNVIKYIQDYHLTPPSEAPYELDRPTINPSIFKAELKKLFRNKRNGFFIECGANDGEYLSNTLALERDQNWTGLLIEANPFMIPNLLKKNRKAWVADVCLSLKPYPQKVKFLHRTGDDKPYYKGMGIIAPGPENEVIAGRNAKNYIRAGLVDCFPVFAILSAINVTRVDYFSLDIEGVEFKVIKSIPFDLLDIRVMSVESNLIPEGKPALISFMESKGFKVADKIGIEIFFVKKDMDLN